MEEKDYSFILEIRKKVIEDPAIVDPAELDARMEQLSNLRRTLPDAQWQMVNTCFSFYQKLNLLMMKAVADYMDNPYELP